MEGRRYRVVFRSEQDALARKSAGCCRLVFNLALSQRQYTYESKGWSQGYVEQCHQLVELKRAYPFLREAPSSVLQQSLKDLQTAYDRFFQGLSGHPKCKHKGRRDSFRFPSPSQLRVVIISRKWARVRLPKFGWVRFRCSRSLPDIIRNVTMVRDSDEWYLSFCGSSGVGRLAARPKTSVGIDRGVVTAIVASNGFTANREMTTPGERKRFVRLQQRLTRQHKGSRRRERAKIQFANLHRTIRRRRQDFAHQVSRQLVNNHDLVVLEDLRVKNMTASARGTMEKPGRNVRAKAALNRAILDKGWGRLRTYLAYKLDKEGGRLVVVNPAFSSQQCSECDHIDAASRVSQAWFACTNCSHAENADGNAAKTILKRGLKIVSAAGLAVAGQGDLHQSVSVNCQPSLREVAQIAISRNESRELRPREEVKTYRLCSLLNSCQVAHLAFTGFLQSPLFSTPSLTTTPTVS